MKLFSLILLLSCLAVAMGAVNLRAEKAEELSQRIVKDAKAKSVELGAQLNAAYDAALSVRNLVTSKASEHKDGWLGLAIELHRAESFEDFLGDAATNDIESINAMASPVLDEGRRLITDSFLVWQVTVFLIFLIFTITPLGPDWDPFNWFWFTIFDLVKICSDNPFEPSGFKSFLCDIVLPDSCCI